MTESDSTSVPARDNLPKAEIVNRVEDSQGLLLGLELRVSIEGRDQPVLLTLDALATRELTDLAAAAELRQIRHLLQEALDLQQQQTERLTNVLGHLSPQLSNLIAPLVDLAHALRHGPR